MKDERVRKVGRNTVHIMKDEPNELDEYHTLCGKSFLVTNSDIVIEDVTCPRCLQLARKET